MLAENVPRLPCSLACREFAMGVKKLYDTTQSKRQWFDKVSMAGPEHLMSLRVSAVSTPQASLN